MATKKKSFEEELKSLEEIVERLEAGMDIEESMKLYEKGMRLSQELEGRLKKIERKVFQVKNIKELDEGKDETPELELFN